jgi:hypothetical protein
MVGIALVGVFNTKVVSNKTEGDVTSLVLSKTSSEWDRMVSKGGKGCNQLIVGQLACLWKAMHAFPDFNIHTVVVNEWGKVILFYDDRR